MQFDADATSGSARPTIRQEEARVAAGQMLKQSFSVKRLSTAGPENIPEGIASGISGSGSGEFSAEALSHTLNTHQPSMMAMMAAPQQQQQQLKAASPKYSQSAKMQPAAPQQQPPSQRQSIRQSRSESPPLPGEVAERSLDSRGSDDMNMASPKDFVPAPSSSPQVTHVQVQMRQQQQQQHPPQQQQQYAQPQPQHAQPQQQQQSFIQQSNNSLPTYNPAQSSITHPPPLVQAPIVIPKNHAEALSLEYSGLVGNDGSYPHVYEAQFVADLCTNFEEISVKKKRVTNIPSVICQNIARIAHDLVEYMANMADFEMVENALATVAGNTAAGELQYDENFVVNARQKKVEAYLQAVTAIAVQGFPQPGIVRLDARALFLSLVKKALEMFMTKHNQVRLTCIY
jgi:hypothetical protein